MLLADLFQPDAEGRFPALLSFSCYPRQIQDVVAVIGCVEAGASDFFTPRVYVHLIANTRRASTPSTVPRDFYCQLCPRGFEPLAANRPIGVFRSRPIMPPAQLRDGRQIPGSSRICSGQASISHEDQRGRGDHPEPEFLKVTLSAIPMGVARPRASHEVIAVSLPHTSSPY